jgi:hypothetical protein
MLEPISPRLTSPMTTRPGEDLLEGREARRAESLVERHLRLHDAGAAGRRLDDAQPELAYALR